MYTLKLDWDDDRVRVVCDALENYITTSVSPSVLDMVTTEQRDALILGAKEASEALADIRRYTETRDEVLADIRRETEAASLMLARHRRAVER